jgi:TIR domain
MQTYFGAFSSRAFGYGSVAALCNTPEQIRTKLWLRLSFTNAASRLHLLPHTLKPLAARLGDLAFLDTGAIDDGDQFLQRLPDAILDASVVVIFATRAYSESRFCRLEMRLALAGGDAATSHLVLALGEECNTVLDALPTALACPGAPTDRRRASFGSRPCGCA